MVHHHGYTQNEGLSIRQISFMILFALVFICIYGFYSFNFSHSSITPTPEADSHLLTELRKQQIEIATLRQRLKQSISDANNRGQGREPDDTFFKRLVVDADPVSVIKFNEQGNNAPAQPATNTDTTPATPSSPAPSPAPAPAPAPAASEAPSSPPSSSSTLSYPELSAPYTSEFYEPLPAHSTSSVWTPVDPWQTCPKHASIDSKKDMQEERERLRFNQCPAYLLPSLNEVEETGQRRSAVRARISTPELPSTFPYLNPSLSYDSFPDPTKCRSQCRWQFYNDWRGADVPDAHIQSSRLIHTREYIGQWHFRDMSDWNLYMEMTQRLHEENGIVTTDSPTQECLLPGAIVYVYNGLMNKFCREVLPNLRNPILLVSGEGDDDSYIQCPDAADHNNVIHWFLTHKPMEAMSKSRVSALPLGLDMYQQTYINQYLFIRYVQRLSMKVAADPSLKAKAPVVPLLSIGDTYAQAAEFEFCSEQSLECSLERSALRHFLGLDEYVYDPQLLDLNKRAMQRGFDVNEISIFFQTHADKYPGRLSMGKTFQHSNGDQEPLTGGGGNDDFAPTHLRGMRMPDLKRYIDNVQKQSDFSLSSPPIPISEPPLQRPNMPIFDTWRKLALINFDSTHKDRQPVHDRLCKPETGNSKWVTCINKMGKTDGNAFERNRFIIDVYALLSEYMYWVSPRGNGLDCFRHWEALLLGSVPIIMRSGLDELFNDGDLPVILVDSFDEVTEELLMAHAPRFMNIRRDFPRRKLLLTYWKYKMMRIRDEGINVKHKNEDIFDLAREKRKCWGHT